MKLTMYTDYGLRMLIYLALLPEGKRASVSEISKKYDVSRNNLNKIAHQLGKAGVIETRQGKGGGLRLNVSPEEVNVGKIIVLLEGETYLEENSDHILKFPIQQATQAFLETFNKYTLADLIRPNFTELQKLLDPEDLRENPE